MAFLSFFSFLRHYHLESQKSRKLSGLWILFSFKCVLSESDTKMQSNAQSLLFFFETECLQEEKPIPLASLVKYFVWFWVRSYPEMYRFSFSWLADVDCVMLRLSQTDPGTVECAKTRNVKCFEKELHTRSGREAMEKREAAGLKTAERAPVCVRNGCEGASCSESPIQIVFCFCRCRRRRNNRLSLTEQCAASSPPKDRVHLIHSLSAAALLRSLLAPPFVVVGALLSSRAD